MIRAPAFAAARVAWAEVELDLGDAKTAARHVAEALLAQSPKDVRVALLLNEAQAALGEPATGPTAADCPTERWLPPAILASCTLGRATRARRDGSRAAGAGAGRDGGRDGARRAAAAGADGAGALPAGRGRSRRRPGRTRATFDGARRARRWRGRRPRCRWGAAARARCRRGRARPIRRFAC